MAVPEVEGYVETFTRALDSVCKSLQLTLDDDAADESVPMEDMVRVEVEEELERLTVLKGEISEMVKERPVTLGKFVKARKDEIGKALDFYEKRLEDSVRAAKEKASYAPPFRKTQEELERVKLARLALTS
jgi:hypothetical protein